MKMRPLSILGGIAAGALILFGSLGGALAQDVPQTDQSQMLEHLGEEPDQASNPPGRVAQLSYAEGSVSLEPAGTSSWTDAVRNRPLTLGDKLWTDRDSRAELDIGDAVIRIGSTTGFSFLNLDEQTAQMQVTAGTVIVHVRELSSGEQDEIDTPNLALTLEQPGTYRVEVSDTGDTTIVKVDDGAALATGGGQSYPIAVQQSVTFTGTATLAADYATLGAPDSLDDWSMQREQQVQQQAEVAQEYVPPDTVGTGDLGSYGTWEATPDWGYAWFPAVGADWAPYSLGNWVWVSPWGWTWVDEEPWGFAPFHYGRWGYWHQRWCWVPGPRRKRAIYAPALVGWVGGGGGGESLSRGAHVGWFPLGPRDVYVPGYHASAAYVRNINMANTRLVNTTEIGRVYGGRAGNVRYANTGVRGAITAVPRSVFTSAQRVGPHRVTLPPGGMNLRATTAAPAIMPMRQSVLGSNAARFVRTPPHSVVDRPVVARLAPPRAPVPFAREQAAMRANGGHPVPMNELARMRPNVPAAAVRLAGPRGVPPSSNMAARERALQQPSVPPVRAMPNDRPPWSASGRAMQPGPAAERSRQQTFAPQQRQPAQEWRSPAQRQITPDRQAPQQRFAVPERAAPVQRFTPQERQVPQQRFNTPERQIPEQRFTPPERQVPQQRFTPPERQAPEQRFTPPERQAPEQRFTPPERQVPQERLPSPRFNPPATHERSMAPREAPARPEGRPSQGRPPSQRPR